MPLFVLILEIPSYNPIKENNRSIKIKCFFLPFVFGALDS